MFWSNDSTCYTTPHLWNKLSPILCVPLCLLPRRVITCWCCHGDNAVSVAKESSDMCWCCHGDNTVSVAKESGVYVVMVTPLSFAKESGDDVLMLSWWQRCVLPSRVVTCWYCHGDSAVSIAKECVDIVMVTPLCLLLRRAVMKRKTKRNKRTRTTMQLLQF